MSNPETAEERPIRPRPKWCDEWDDVMRREWPLGTSQMEFSRRFGISPSSVHQRAKKLGLLDYLKKRAIAYVTNER